MVLCFSVLQHLAQAAAHQSPSCMAGWGRNLMHMHTIQRTRSAQVRHFKVMPPVCMGRRSSKIATRKVRPAPARCVTTQSRLQGSTYACMQTSQDARKAKLYGKIGKLIVQAVKAGGTDVVGNPRLKEVLKQAQQASIPKDIIERNIKRASDKSQADFQEVLILALPHLPCCSFTRHINCYASSVQDFAFLIDITATLPSHMQS